MRLRKIGRQILNLVEKGLQPDSKGLYLVAGQGIWMPLEVKSSMRNFIVTGPRPYLPPILAWESRSPRGYLVLAEGHALELQELRAGGARSVFKKQLHDPVDDREHRTSRAGMDSFSGSRGGSERDRRQQRENESFRTLVRDGAKVLRHLHAENPGEIVFLSGPRELRSELERHLDAGLTRRLKVLGAARKMAVSEATRELDAWASEDTAARIVEFHEARAEGGKVALGPNDVLQALWSGHAGRVYLDEFDPIPGVVCTGCGVHRPGLELRCPFCGDEVKPTSIAQDVVTYALSHRPAAGLTFVGSGERWLRDLGGMAALLATKGARPRKSPALR
jgi:hypothetical protein